MPRYEIDIAPLFNKTAVGFEAVQSMLRVLYAAGYDTNEARQLISSVLNGVLEPDDELDLDTTGEPIDTYAIAQQLRSEPEYATLERLQKRLSTVDDLDQSPEALEKALNIVQSALEALETLQGKAIIQATEAGIQVERLNDAWREAASDEELDREDEILFLDSWEMQAGFHWDILSRISHRLAREGETDRLNALCDLIDIKAVALSGRLRDQIEQNKLAASNFQAVRAAVAQYAGTGELNQSEVIDQINRDLDLGTTGYMLDGWMTAFERQGLLRKYKRSGRWKIEIL